MHLKNFSLIVRKRTVKLSPAYDLLNSTLALPAAREELALPLRGKKRAFTEDDLVDYYGRERLGLTVQSVEEVLGVFSAALPTWSGIID